MLGAEPPLPPPTITEFEFIGLEGTSGAAGTSPLSGTFSFESSAAGTFSIVLDTNRNGTFGDYPDTVLIGYAQPGMNEIEWNGLDAADQPVPAGNVGYDCDPTCYESCVNASCTAEFCNVDGCLDLCCEPTDTPPEGPGCG